MVDMRSETTAADPEVDFVALPVGAQIGRYEVLSVLGQGGFGITYRARDVQLDREVAIKEYLPTALAVRQNGITVMPRSTKVAEDFTWGRDRFVAEGRVMATLHRAPGIVRVFDFLEINGTAYIVMEMLHGDTLEGHIKKNGRLDASAIDRILWPLLDGLEQVHNAGFLHRDIKPANILLDAAGNPTLIDFGASRAAMVGRTVAMTAIFTPGYAAPEQFTSAKQGPWTDIYGVSATLYHAITGVAPPSAFDRMLDDGYKPVAKHAPAGFAPGLLAGIDAGLAVRATDRPQSIAGWRQILSLTTAPENALTVAAMTRPDPAAAIVAKAPRPIAAPPPAPAQATSPAPSPALAPASAALEAAPVGVEPGVSAPTVPAGAPKSRMAVYAGAAVAALILAGGGGYFILGSKPSPQIAVAPQGVAVQDLKIEDLERVLAERRKADAAAAEKKRLEEEAQRKAEADAAAKRAADVELADAQLKRRKAEEDLAKLKADMEARRQAEAGQREQADAAARRAAEEAAQRKAEAEMAALKQAEEDARRKAAAEADAKLQADEALVKAQAERQKAEAEARQKAEAEAKQKAESSTKDVVEAEARQKADAEAAAATDKKTAEAAEMALRLTPPDRQRIQVALTSLGFDTRGNDGAFGPRSREMIASWQKARNQPGTGFFTGTQHQALLREAAPAITRYNDEQKKIEDEKKKADEEAKAKIAAAAPAVTLPPAATSAPAAAIAPAAAPAGTVRWIGSAMCDYWPGPIPVSVLVTGGQGSGTGTGRATGTTVTVNISGSSYSGSINGRLRNGNPKILVGSFSGALSGSQIRARTYIRADFKSQQGPNESSCTIELDRAG